ncbi:Alpha/Beta hydrolase protein [Lasiosphaeria hispida]|uniref:Alpha/Beta hydrolase protein n=1 Tax=Lasiosphaeria hispida TaxID=260671 RepID=A0AAJ0HAQ2_9PEZI|nr:Alpha/Beta hydrolase protein [Lasiosphaeria hispida]
MLPEPTLTFTLPSLHDGLTLDCRVYHPYSLAASPKSPPWQKHAAIVAHPYAPLGGCYDDPVVDIVAGTLLRLGLLVGTFNFRGAHRSAGRTSWTAKAEEADYMSVVGFMSYYVQFLDPFRPTAPRGLRSHDDLRGQATPASPSRAGQSIPSPSLPSPHDIPILLLSGYSYGAMVTTHLPCLEAILAPFDTPNYGSPAAEIRLRAEHLAEMQNTIISSARATAVERQSGHSHRRSMGVRIGGDEENRKSHDSRRSFSSDLEDRIHKGVAELMAKARKGQRKRQAVKEQAHHGDETPRAPVVPETPEKQEPAHDCLLLVSSRVTHRPVYLLVSPLQGVITNLATMSFPLPFSGLTRRTSTRSVSSPVQTTQVNADERLQPGSPVPEAENKLVSNPTLAIYGDRDGFVAARKLRDWASRLQGVPNSQFRAHEVSSAGHFWAQGKAALILRDAIKTFTEGVLSSNGR